MNIGTLGAGSVAQTIARYALPLGHRVVLSNSRGPDSLAALVDELGLGAEAGTPQQAAEQDLVVLAVNWPNVQKALYAVPRWTNRILVDATNRIADTTPPSFGDVSGRTSSEIVADLATGAKVVKAFNSAPMTWVSDLTPDATRPVLFLSGDHPEAKEPVRALMEEIGFPVIDLGSLATGGRLQQVGGPLAGIRLDLTERLPA